MIFSLEICLVSYLDEQEKIQFMNSFREDEFDIDSSGCNSSSQHKLSVDYPIEFESYICYISFEKKN